jgi:large conductance mechanosensitive channel
MFSGLKAFLLRGDVITLAVAVIIGGAFTNIINSVVADLINPLLALLTGGGDFSKSFIFNGTANATTGEEEGGFRVGSFIQAVINFIMVGIVLYMLIKAAGKNTEDVK